MSEGRVLKHYEVRLSTPVLREDGTTSYRSNEEVHIITTSIQRAMEISLENFPEATVHDIHHRGRHPVIIDPEVLRWVDDEGRTEP